MKPMVHLFRSGPEVGFTFIYFWPLGDVTIEINMGGLTLTVDARIGKRRKLRRSVCLYTISDTRTTETRIVSLPGFRADIGAFGAGLHLGFLEMAWRKK